MILYYPVPEGIRISQVFGENPKWYPQSGGHNGIDFACNVGTLVYSAQDGKVIRATEEKTKQGYGRQIRIQTTDGILVYGHLSVLGCKENDEVVAKQVIGKSGGNVDDPCSGYSTGPHLHFEIRPSTGGYQGPGGLLGAIDPMPHLVGHSYTGTDPVTMPLFRARCIANSINIRAGAGIHYVNLGYLKFGEIVAVYEVSPVSGWFKIHPTLEQWCSGYPMYMLKLQD